MGNQCTKTAPTEHKSEQLESFRNILQSADTKRCTNHNIVSKLVEECQRLTHTKSIQFVYSRTVTDTKKSKASKYGGALQVKIQGINLGQIRYDERQVTDSEKETMIGLVLYAVQIMERNYLRIQAASVISVVGAQRECKSIPAILASVSSVIEESLRCESVSMFRVDSSAKSIIQIHPKHRTIGSFNQGLLGYVAKSQKFVVYNDDQEKDDLELGKLQIETENENAVESVLCVPILSNETNDTDGMILALNKQDGAPFGYLGVDLLQILSVEVGDILENFATKINWTVEDALHDGHGSASSLIEYYKSLAREKSMFSADRPQRQQIQSVFQAAQVVCKRRSVIDMFRDKMEKLLLSSTDPPSSDPPSCDPSTLNGPGAIIEPEEEVLNAHVENDASRPPRGLSDIIRKAISSGDLTNSNQTALGEIKAISFDPFGHSPSRLGELAVTMFLDLDLLQTLKVAPRPFSHFIKEIMRLYRNSNPYHNVYHGFSVLSFSYAFIVKTQLKSKFPPLDLFALMVSALCHDVDHPGNTNAFQIATESQLARTHNDQSVLENHHCNVTFAAMYKKDCNFMTDFSNEDRKRLRKIVIQSILATDMSHHFELCSTLDQIDKGQFQQSLLKREKTDKFKQIISNVFVHAADLTAPVQPLEIALKWGKRVCQEFTDQVQKEEELGLESLPMMQGLEDQENFLKSQRGFYKFVLRPLFKSVSRLWPNLSFLYLQLLANEQYISDEADRLEKMHKGSSEGLTRLQSMSVAKTAPNATSKSRSFKFTRSETSILRPQQTAVKVFEHLDDIEMDLPLAHAS